MLFARGVYYAGCVYMCVYCASAGTGQESPPPVYASDGPAIEFNNNIRTDAERTEGKKTKKLINKTGRARCAQENKTNRNAAAPRTTCGV